MNRKDTEMTFMAAYNTLQSHSLNYWSYKLVVDWSLDCKPHWIVQLSNHTRMESIIAAVTMDVDRNLKSAKDKHNKKIKPFQMAVQLPKNIHCHWRLAGLKRYVVWNKKAVEAAVWKQQQKKK